MLKVMFGGRVGAGNLGVNQRERGAWLALPSFPCIVELCRVDSPEHDSTQKGVVCQAWLGEEVEVVAVVVEVEVQLVCQSMVRGLLLCTRAYLSTGSTHRARLSLRGRR